MIVPEIVFAFVKVNVSLPVPPVKLAKLLKVKVAVPSLTVPLLLLVMLQALVVFSATKVFVAEPPVKVAKLSKVSVLVASLMVPEKPWVAVEPVKVAVDATSSKVRVLARVAPAAALTRVILEKPAVGL